MEFVLIFLLGVVGVVVVLVLGGRSRSALIFVGVLLLLPGLCSLLFALGQIEKLFH